MERINEKELIEKLKKEGFKEIRICPLPPNIDTPEHTHNEHTIHIILEGDLIITDRNGTKLYNQGDRVEFPAGTKHKAKSSNGGKMIIGVK